MKRSSSHGLGVALAAVMLAIGVAPGFSETTCEPTVWDLTAGQHYDVGSITVSNDDVNVYVTYTLDFPGATFGSLHLWMGSDLDNLPANDNGTPIPGQFCQADGGACYGATGLTTYTFAMPFADLALPGVPDVCGAELYVVTHAEVLVDLDGDGEVDDETAFGGDQPGPGPRWWFYGVYTVCCDFNPPADVCETAFAKGGWVWTTSPKSNPEGLESLQLTRNRWGWAVNLTSTGVTTYEIWAGAGLNDTANGVLVGELTIDWDGATAVVTYTLDPGFTLAEVHLYAGDAAPMTTAPGQYGYLDAPGAATYTFTVPLANSDADGVWLIAHAVVCAEE